MVVYLYLGDLQEIEKYEKWTSISIAGSNIEWFVPKHLWLDGHTTCLHIHMAAVEFTNILLSQMTMSGPLSQVETGRLPIHARKHNLTKGSCKVVPYN